MRKLTDHEIRQRAEDMVRLQTAIEREDETLDDAKRLHKHRTGYLEGQIAVLRREIATGHAEPEQLDLPTPGEDEGDEPADPGSPDFSEVQEIQEEMRKGSDEPQEEPPAPRRKAARKPAQEVPEKDLEEHSPLQAAYERGKKARNTGVAERANPYDVKDPKWKEWRNGWYAADLDIGDDE